ncbi:MAG: archease [Nanoarchaeota archaeon]|nr:archease [Nanoarchaeota archaeon]
MKFKFIEHTADVGVEAYGKNIEETFANVALGLFEIMSNTKKIKDTKMYKIKIKSENIESLLYDFLEKFLIIHDIENAVFTRVDVKKITEKDGFVLEAIAFGEEFNPKKHESRSGVKAVTYMNMSIKKENNKYRINVILDI